MRKRGRRGVRQSAVMDAVLLKYAAQAAPRYTSYPTAPHFSSAVDNAAYGAWLDALAPDQRLSLYLHVPYCRSLCWYCGCNTYGFRRAETLDAYVGDLLREIALVAARTGKRAISDIHWGGGTPNALTPAQIETIFASLAQHFTIAPDAEHSVEMDPRFVTPARAAAYRNIGVTRASFGVQDFNPHVQAAIGRMQPFAQVQQAVALLRAAGVGKINLDLMYGLPQQTVEDVRETARRAASLSPDRLAIFGYAHVPWFKKRQRLMDESALPNAGTRLAQAKAAQEELTALGFVAVGMDHFARPDDALAIAAAHGALRRNFQGYVAGEALPIIGLGPSSISKLPQGYAQNITDVTAWRTCVREDRLPIARGHALSADDALRARLIEDIMCGFEADLSPLDEAALRDVMARMSPLQADGVVTLDARRVRIPEAMRPACRIAAQALDAYAAAPTRHSKAI